MKTASSIAHAPAITGSEHRRLDIEGMRAVAVIMVLAYHARLPLSGGGYAGVDVFFVLSGFLITGLLLREYETEGTIRFMRFYARRARRLLPASITVLVSVSLLGFLILPATRLRGLGLDVVWSSVYVVNWRFASQSVDYLAADQAHSAVQHFWSLAIEEQFYAFWPVLILLLAGLTVRRWSPRRTLIAGLSLITLLSLVASIALTSSQPSQAYFVTPTRIWELGIGASLAVLAPHIARFSSLNVRVLGPVGLVAVVATMVLFNDGTPFPGYAALLPVLGTAAVIAAGISHPNNRAASLLQHPGLVRVGGLSYSLYLWHWPLLVLADANWGPLTPLEGALVVVGSAVPAALSYKFVERPTRRSSWFVSPARKGVVLGAVLTALGVLAGALLIVSVPETSSSAAPPPPTVTTTALADEPSVEAPVPTTLPPIVAVSSSASIFPDPVDARSDKPSVYGDGCHQNGKDSEPIFCEFGPESSTIVAVVGDSHAAQWIPALSAVAEAHDFTLRSYTKSGCHFVGDAVLLRQDRENNSCREWNERMVPTLSQLQPDLLVVTSRAVVTERVSAQDLEDGFREQWSRVVAAGIPVVVLLDTPNPRVDVPECVVENLDNLLECAFDLDAASEGPKAQRAAARSLGLPIIDMSDRICTPTMCPPVIDGILVWRDTHHLSATYARILAPVLAARVNPLLTG